MTTPLIESLIALSGQESVIVIRKPFVQFTGSLEGGILLGQLLYWTPRARIPGGWIAKTDNDFSDELCLSNYGVRKARKAMEDMGILETKRKRFSGSPTTHYRLILEELQKQWVAWLSQMELAKTQDATCEKSKSLTENTAQTTQRHVATATPAPVEAESVGDRIKDPECSIARGAQDCGDCVICPTVIRIMPAPVEVIAEEEPPAMLGCNHDYSYYDSGLEISQCVKCGLEKCEECKKQIRTTAEMPYIGETCICHKEAALVEAFGPKPEREHRPLPPHWRDAIKEPWATWGAESDEFQRQLQEFHDSGRVVQELGYKLQEATGLKPLWGKPEKVRGWSAGLWELYEEAGHSIETAIAAAVHLRISKMTIAGPYSIVKQARAFAAEKDAPLVAPVGMAAGIVYDD